MSETQRDIEFGGGEPVALVEGSPEGKQIAGRTPWQLARARLRRDKITMGVLTVVALAILLAIAAPILTAMGVLDPTTFHNELIDGNTGGLPRAGGGGLSSDHLLGVEPGTGRDVLSRIVLGVTFSMTVAISATLIAVIVGTVLGLIAGFLGGWVDFAISRVVDMVLSFPQTLMLLALSGMFIEIITNAGVPAGNASNGTYIVLVLGLFGWPTIARIIRGQVLSLREREFVEAAKSLGASNFRIYFKELLPNLWAPLLVYGTLLMPAYISAEAALSYLGVGIHPPTPTLGNVLVDSINYSSADFTFFFFPALLIAIIVVSFNLLGDGLRDALDPKAER
jgi:peptide/nickel transport system permease protein